MTWLGWLLLVYGGLSIVAALFTAWFGWHLRRYRARHAPRHEHTRALWLAELECSESSGRDTLGD